VLEDIQSESQSDNVEEFVASPSNEPADGEKGYEEEVVVEGEIIRCDLSVFEDRLENLFKGLYSPVDVANQIGISPEEINDEEVEPKEWEELEGWFRSVEKEEIDNIKNNDKEELNRKQPIDGDTTVDDIRNYIHDIQLQFDDAFRSL